MSSGRGKDTGEVYGEARGIARVERARFCDSQMYSMIRRPSGRILYVAHDGAKLRIDFGGFGGPRSDVNTRLGQSG